MIANAPDPAGGRQDGSRTGRRQMRHAFTIDVEDWYEGIPVDAATKDRAERRLRIGLDRLLALLAQRSVRGTFFVLGPLAKNQPRIVQSLAESGHEVGCHGWSHDLLYTMTRERFREETIRARDAIADATGTPVTAYRAAYFSIIRESYWALEELAGLGFLYDSSIFPVRNWRYGIPDFPLQPKRIETDAGPISELPITVREVFGARIPAAGGAYFRIYPYAMTRSNFHAAEDAHVPVVFYLHPWELDPGHPRVPFYWKARLTHYVNLRTTEPKLRRLLQEFEFGPLSEVLEHEISRTGA
jgi:polysaccharide deacetylase family protein (PEP-CTERM system associated)